MAETPTAWWCPECGYVSFRQREFHPRADEWPDHGRVSDTHGGWHGTPLEPVPLLTPDMSLADLAVRLRDLGYDVQALDANVYRSRSTLVVAAKETADAG